VTHVATFKDLPPPLHTVQLGGGSTLPVLLQTPTASLLAQYSDYTVYINLAGTDPGGAHLPRPVFSVRKAHYVS